MTKSRLEGALMTAAVVIPLIGTVIAIVLLWQKMVTGRDLALLGVFYVLTAMGITVGYHRMLTHRSFDAHPAVRFLLLMLGSMSWMGPCRLWAATHIKHHANADKEHDPHSPLEGFFHAHMGWFIYGEETDLKVYGTWMDKDPLIMFMSRTFFFWALLSLAIPYWIGGWTGFLWGGLVRIALVDHVTWSVNSVCHLFGKRPFQTPDRSRNHWAVGLLALGEGWHNNHHAFPRSAFHGLRWWQFDFSAYVIRLLEKTGLVWNVWRIPADKMNQRLQSSAEAELISR